MTRRTARPVRLRPSAFTCRLVGAAVTVMVIVWCGAALLAPAASATPGPAHPDARPTLTLPGPVATGYREATATGLVVSFGDAPNVGSLAGVKLDKPVVGMAPTPDGQGYWLVASDGGIFSFGDAAFYGSTGAIRLDKPVVGMAPTPDGHGYWLVASDGGIFSFGDAAFHGSVPGLHVAAARVVSIVPAGDDAGYLVVAGDGTSWSFGDGPRFSALSALGAHVSNIVDAAVTGSGAGLWMVGADGGLFTLGDAPYFGSLPGDGMRRTDVVAMSGFDTGGPPTSPGGGSGGPAWTAPVSFDPSATGASSVSCASSLLCAAVDGTDKVWTWTGSWSAPTVVNGATLSGVSCASATFCVATGMTGAGPTMTTADVYDGTTWSPAPSFTSVPTVGGLVAVSCADATSCTAVGDSVGTGGSASTLAETFNGNSWTVDSTPDPTAPSSGGYSLTAVSCPTASMCAAVGAYTSGPEAVSFVETDSASTWAVASTPDLQPDFSLSSVSCATATACTAVGTEAFPHTPQPSTGLVDTYDGTAWSLQPAPPATPLWPVSCPGTSNCAAGGRDGTVTAWDGTSWSAPQDVDGAAMLTSMSCPSTAFCMASDNDGSSVTMQPVAPAT